MYTVGDNFVRLEGKVSNIKVTTYSSGTSFRATLNINTNLGTCQKIPISGWGDVAEQLSSIKDGTLLRVYGHIETHSYKSNCRHCNGPITSFWTVIGIDYYLILGENYEG